MAAGHGDMACAILFNFEFCLRAKSEGMAVFKGSNAFVFLLPEHLPKGAWVNSAGNVSFRMRRRKHRRGLTVDKRMLLWERRAPLLCMRVHQQA